MKYKKIVVLGIIFISILIVSSKVMAKTATVNTDTLNLRKEASTDAKILEQLNKGKKLEVLEEIEDWAKVKVNGMTGFVHKDYIKIEEEIVEKENTVSEEITTENEKVEETDTQNTIETTTTQTEDEKEENTNIIEEFEISKRILESDTTLSILPLINANKIGNLKKGEAVTVLDKVNNWLYIQTDEISGWIRSNVVGEGFIETTTTTQTKPEENKENEKLKEKEPENTETKIEEKTMYVNYSSIYVRKGPSTSEQIVDTLVLNAQVTVIAENGDWYKVKVAGKDGYIAKRLLSNKQTETTTRSAEERDEVEQVKHDKEEKPTSTASTTSSKGQEIVDYAKQYLGCKYVYGASGPNTFDCSGFTMYVFKHFGISLSHSATAQSKNGTYVAKENLQPGDLVFFKDYETMDGIGHCGIYVGDGNFIHASSGTGYCVKISTLLSGSYLNRYETAKRII